MEQNFYSTAHCNIHVVSMPWAVNDSRYVCAFYRIVFRHGSRSKGQYCLNKTAGIVNSGVAEGNVLNDLCSNVCSIIIILIKSSKFEQ